MFYATLSVCSLAWLVARSTETTSQFVWLFAALLCAPFFVFNSTQVMMETAVLPMLTLAAAAAIDLDRHGPSRQAAVILFVAATLALARGAVGRAVCVSSREYVGSRSVALQPLACVGGE